MKRNFSLIEQLKKVPWWGWVAGIGSFALQTLFYYLSNWLANVTGSINWAVCTKIDCIDNAIPIIPIFAIIYIYAFIFWVCAPVVVSLSGKENFKKFAIGQSIAYFIGFVVYIFLPTYMDRASEGIIEYATNGNHWLLKTIYSFDGGNYAFNLCPSYHCLTSVYSFLAVYKLDGVSLWYKVYSCIVAVLICLATLFIKQHYFLDLVFGVTIAIVVYFVVEMVFYHIHKKDVLKKPSN